MTRREKSELHSRTVSITSPSSHCQRSKLLPQFILKSKTKRKNNILELCSFFKFSLFFHLLFMFAPSVQFSLCVLFIWIVFCHCHVYNLFRSHCFVYNRIVIMKAVLQDITNVFTVEQQSFQQKRVDNSLNQKRPLTSKHV